MSASQPAAASPPMFEGEEAALLEAIRLFVTERVEEAKAASAAATTALAERVGEAEKLTTTVQSAARKPVADAQAFAAQARTAAAEATDAAGIARSWASAFLVSRARALT